MNKLPSLTSTVPAFERSVVHAAGSAVLPAAAGTGRGGPARLVAVQAEILLDMVVQPNLPGTVTEYPNWQLRLPVAAADIARLPATRQAGSAARPILQVG